MKETVIPMKKRLRILNDRGIVSMYFLAMFLYVTSVVSVLMMCDMDRMKTLINMRKANIYLNTEAEVIEDFKCRLLNQDIEETIIDLDTCTYMFEMYDTQCYISIYGEMEEDLLITFDPSTNEILKYESIRNE